MKPESVKAWSSTADELLLSAGSDGEVGLSEKEAGDRLRRYGENRLEQKEESLARRTTEPFTEPMMILLLVTAALFAGLGEVVDAVALFIIISVMASIEIYQEMKTETAIRSLRMLAVPTASTLRNGVRREVPSTEVVPGDVTLLSAGHRVPADARLLESFDLSADESALTGESLPSYKDATVVLPEGAALGERKNMVFAGTLVASGKGKALVVGTGPRTELGRIASLAESIHESPTPLQVGISQLTKWIAVSVIALTGATVALALLRGQPLVESALVGLSLLVVTIPEDLPILTYVILIASLIQMARRQALIRKLFSAETLGSTTTICSDKTGTLTKNKMEVRTVHANGRSYDLAALDGSPWSEHLSSLARAAILCNDSLPSKGRVQPTGGNPVDVALLSAMQNLGFDAWGVRKDAQLLHEVPFDNARRMMLTVYRMRDGSVEAFVKGAPEVVIGGCSSFSSLQRDLPLGLEDRRELTEAVRRMTEKGLRVLAFAQKRLAPEAPLLSDALESGYVFVGLCGLEDPPRPEAKEAIAQARRAGIRTIMLTGDHPQTALAVADSLQLANDGSVITGQELDSLDDGQLAEALSRVSIFARVTPEHKLRIVKSLKARGEVVAVTGDGINDAPALREADIGAAMGSGTDVAKEAAAMTIADDNFATIVLAVREGRRLYDNLRKAIQYYIPSKIAILLTVFFSIFLGFVAPLTPLQIILMEVINDIQASTTFATEPAEPGILDRPPRNRSEPIITGRITRQISARAVAVFLGALTVYLLYLGQGAALEKARTAVFSNILISLTLMALFSRSERVSVRRLGLGSNRFMLWVLAVSLVIVVLVANLGPLQLIFGTVALSASDWLLLAVVSLFATGWIEVWKVIHR